MHPAPRKLGGGNFEIESPGLSVNRDEILHYEGGRWAPRRWTPARHDDEGAEPGSAHSSVRDADHVGDTREQQLLGQRQHAPFRHARSADRACAAQYENGVCVDVEGGIVDPARQIFDASKTARLAMVRLPSDAGDHGVADRSLLREPRRARPALGIGHLAGCVLNGITGTRGGIGVRLRVPSSLHRRRRRHRRHERSIDARRALLDLLDRGALADDDRAVVQGITVSNVSLFRVSLALMEAPRFAPRYGLDAASTEEAPKASIRPIPGRASRPGGSGLVEGS